MNTMVRRIPKQERSRKKVEKIIASAKELIGLRGNDAVSMREIATRAELPISTLYQYFPDKSALLNQIMQEYLALTRDQLHHHFNALVSIDHFLQQIGPAVDDFFALFGQDPALCVLWAAMQADPRLCAIEAESSQSNAVFLAQTLVRLSPRVDKVEAKLAFWHLLHSASTSAQLAMHLPELERQLLADELTLTLRLRVQALVS